MTEHDDLPAEATSPAEAASPALEVEAEEVNEDGTRVATSPAALVKYEQHTELARLSDTRSIDELVQRRQLIKQVAEQVMEEEHHYGAIPGTDGRKVLLKPGAEVLCSTFMLSPNITTRKTWNDDEPPHLDVEAWCTMTHIPTGVVVATGIEGFCSTREEKYGWRQAKNTCPQCGEATVLRSKDKPEWFCWRKLGGCGQVYAFESEVGKQIETQEVGKVPNEKLADTYNTVVKMAQKRALVAAVLIATGASDTFTQDVEDTGGETTPKPKPKPRTADREDTKQQPALSSPAQHKLVKTLVEECRAAGLFVTTAGDPIDDDQFAVSTANYYRLDEQLVANADGLEAVLALLTQVQASNLIERLQTLKKNAKAKEAA